MRGIQRTCLAALVLLLSAAGGQALAGEVTEQGGVPHVLNAEPTEGAKNLRLEERWRVGAGEEDGSGTSTSIPGPAGGASRIMWETF